MADGTAVVPPPPPLTLTGVSGVSGALHGGGLRADAGWVHALQQLGAAQQWVGEGLGRQRAVSLQIEQDGLL